MEEQTAEQTTVADRPARTYRPLPVEVETAQKRLPPGWSMNDVIRASLKWFASDPDALAVLERYMPGDGHPGGRPAGSRDSKPRRLRGGGRWLAAWTPDGATLYELLPGPAGLTADRAHEVLRIHGAFVLEQCDDTRAGQLAGWREKDIAEQIALRPARDRLTFDPKAIST